MKYLRILLLGMVAVVLSGWVSQAQAVSLILESPVAFVYWQDLENDNALIPIQWDTTFEITDETDIIIEQVLGDGETIDVLIPHTEPWEILPGLAYVAPTAPDDLDVIVLSAQLINDDNIMATANMIIDIETSPDEPRPALISQFDILNVEFDADERLLAEVAWVVDERLDNTNLVFEQIIDEDTVVNIEQARYGMLIDQSSGTGLGVLQAPIDNVNSLQLRVRLVDLLTGQVIDEMVAVWEMLVTTSTSQPTAIRTTPTNVPTSPDSPAIFSFTITPDPVVRGGEIILSWETQSMANLSITRLSEVGQIFLESIADNLTDSGSFTYQLPDYYVSQAEFILLGTDANNNRYQSMVVVDIVCGFVPVYIPDGYVNMDCPVNQQTVQIATQSFENGFMLWRADTRQIYTLFNGGIFWVYDDIWTLDIVYDMPSEPPAGFIAPERGFGYLWATNESVNFQLGWATSPEQSSTVTLETYMIPARFVDVIMLELPNGQVVQIGSAVGSWRYVD